MPIPRSYPPRVRQALKRLIDDLMPVAADLVALVTYGSLVKEDFHSETSDINLAMVLRSVSEKNLVAIRGPLRTAWRSVRVRPYLLAKDEIARVADVYPILVADIQAHHHVLAGADPFASVVIDRAHLRLRVEQELRNHLLRLRRHYVFSGDNAVELAKALRGSANSLGIELYALLRLLDQPAGTGRLDSVVATASEALELDAGVLDRLAAMRRGEHEPDVRGLYFSVIDVVERAVHVVCGLRAEADPP